MDTIDHYEGIVENRTIVLEREAIALDMLQRIGPSNLSILDAGCGDATFLGFVHQRFPDFALHGCDFAPSRLVQAKIPTLQLTQADLHKGLPYEDAQFDVVYSGEVLEHLWNPDSFVKEIQRVTKPGGHVIMSTPNLLAWYNRVLMLVGVQPLFVEMSTESGAVGAGILKRFKLQDRPVGHVRIFTRDALADLLTLHGFETITIRGAGFERLPGLLGSIDRMVSARASRLASDLVILAKRR